MHRAGELLPTDPSPRSDDGRPAGETWWLPPGPLREAVTAAAPASDPHAVLWALVSAMPCTADGGPDLPRTAQGLLGLVLGQAVRVGTAGQLLDDVGFLAHADPLAVTAAFAAVPDGRYAGCWRAAGPALIGERAPGVRGELLRARLWGAEQAGPGPAAAPVRWRAEWAHWPALDAPLVAAAVGEGRYAGRLLVVDAKGAVEQIDLTDGQALGPAPFEAPAQLRALVCTPEGGVLGLTATGMPLLLDGPAPHVLPGGGISALAGLPASGDPGGAVHWLAPGRAVGERLHDGPVTAVGAVLPAPARPDADPLPLVLSGGLDGRVRVWRPGFAPAADPVHEGSGPVVSVAVALPVREGDGPLTAAAWTDGVVRLRRLDGEDAGPGRQDSLELRLGSPVTAVQLDGAGRLLVLLTDGVVCVGAGDPGPADTR